MSAVVIPQARLTTSALCKGVDAARDAQRLLFKAGAVAGEAEVFGVTTLIDEAIWHLVAARAHLNRTTETGGH